jgi:hypothetical protein
MLNPTSRYFRLIGGFLKDSPSSMVEIDSAKECIVHLKNKELWKTRTYNLEMCERFVTQGKWEEIKDETVQTV